MKNKIKKLFLLSWKRILLIVCLWIASVILHNAVSVVFGIEEAFFFILAIFIIPIYFIIGVLYTTYKKLT